MVSTLNTGEEAQLTQTIEMFEVITQSQPQDYQSLEILKEAYLKLGRPKEAVKTSKRIAHAYVQLGQLSSAILEYETILQRDADDKDALAAMAEIESKANSLTSQASVDTQPNRKTFDTAMLHKKAAGDAAKNEIDDGRRMMHKIFVESKIISAGDFEMCWNTPSITEVPEKIFDPFVQLLAEKGITPIEKSLKIILGKTLLAYLTVEKYDVDMELARSFPREICQRWCVLPFDRMSKSVMVATANPFNKQAALELQGVTPNRILWYIVPPLDIVKVLRKTFR